jgi:hypothetical protein
MLKPYLIIIALLFVVVISISSCSKESQDTSLGENEFKANVNGKTMIFNNAIIAETQQLNDPFFRFLFIGSNGDDPDISPTILVSMVYPGKEFFFEQRGLTDNGEGTVVNPLGRYIERENSSGLEFIDSDTETTRIATASITSLDTINKLVSGTFRFTSFDDTLGQFYEVTDGVFNNLKYINKD